MKKKTASKKLTVSKKLSVRPQPLIAVRDVRASSRWYQHVLGLTALPDHEHRDSYDRLYSGSQFVVQLHAWDEEEHPNLINADAAPHGHGVVLWFELDDFDAAVKRARSLKAEVIEGPQRNPNAGHMEMWLRDPDGYVVAIASRGRGD
jgi:catechol 2,3-dioxygenase-like lactoylglutathione lyase family enzyme